MRRFGKLLPALIPALALAAQAPTESNRAQMECLVRAYPEVTRLVGPNEIEAGPAREPLRFDEALPPLPFEVLLQRADLRAQLSQEYPLGVPVAAPVPNFDPGRLRSMHFLGAIYGHSPAQVKRQLTPVEWPACQCQIKLSAVNGAAQALAAVAIEIARKPELMPYVARPNGAFNWRNISGTQRISPHGLGIAVDFTLPKSLNHYWRWTPSSRPIQYPLQILQDRKFMQVIAIFEAHGFIWGGKWHHFDSVHFEYRPELTALDCPRAQ